MTENGRAVHPPQRRPPLWLAAATVAAGWVAAYGIVGWVALYLQHPVHKDFRIFYVAAEAGLRYGWSSMYDVSTLRALSNVFPPDQRYIDAQTAYANPPLLAWLIAPLTALPFPTAYLVWALVSFAAFVWSWHITASFAGLPRLALLLGGLAMWPVIDALYFGQPSLVIVGLVAGSFWLCSRERPLAGGMLLALATALKPQVVLVLPFALLASGRTKAFVAWAATCAVLAGLFVVTLGLDGIERWWQALRYLQSDPHHSYYTLAYLLGAGPVTYAGEALLGATALVISLKRRHQLEMVFAAGLVGSLAASFHLHQSDYAELVLVGWLLMRVSPSVWQKVWLASGLGGLQAVTLAQPLPQLLLDAAWLVGVGAGSFIATDHLVNPLLRKAPPVESGAK